MKLVHALSMGNYYDGKYKSIIKRFSLFRNFFKIIILFLSKLNLYRKAGYQHPYSLINEIIEKKFNNLIIKIPANYENYLNFIYGNNWKIPQNFNWLKDSPATKLYDEN